MARRRSTVFIIFLSGKYSGQLLLKGRLMQPMLRPLNVGMVGGGSADAFFGHVHRKALALCNMRIVAGVLSRDGDKCIEMAKNFSPYPIRGYRTVQEMVDGERNLPLGGEKMDFVVIVAPNNAHFDAAMACIAAGYPVFCEKPMTTKLVDAATLTDRVRETAIPFGLAHTYLGHWTTKLARWMIEYGLIGNVRRVISKYDQGWLAEKLEDTGQRQATWRTDPEQAGESGAGGDIGTHALIQAEYLTGQTFGKMLFADVRAIPGRRLDDDFFVFGRMLDGTTARISACQIAIGHQNDLGTEINGDKGSIIWNQEDSEKLRFFNSDGVEMIFRRGAMPKRIPVLGAPEVPDWLLGEQALPGGHNQGLTSALARLYWSFGGDVRRYLTQQPLREEGVGYASVHQGLRGVRFIHNAVELSRKLNG